VSLTNNANITGTASTVGSLIGKSVVNLTSGLSNSSNVAGDVLCDTSKIYCPTSPVLYNYGGAFIFHMFDSLRSIDQ